MIKYFTILLLPETTNIREVKKSYRNLAKIHHPDKNSGSAESTERFKLIQEAYEKILEYFDAQAIKSQRTRTNSGFKNRPNKEKEDYKSERANTNSRNTHTNSNKTYRKPDTSNSSEEKQNRKRNSFKYDTEDLNKDHKMVKIHVIGEEVNVGYFEYIVIKSNYSKTIGENYFKSEADGIYLIIELKILNKSNIPRKLHNYMFRLSTNGNDFFEFSSKGLSAITMSGIKSIDFFGKELNPKIPSTVNLIFEVPDKNEYFLNLCGGEYNWVENNICLCKDIEVVSVT